MKIPHAKERLQLAQLIQGDVPKGVELYKVKVMREWQFGHPLITPTIWQEAYEYQIPLGWCEGKAVYVDDTLYTEETHLMNSIPATFDESRRPKIGAFDFSTYSWNPPKPKTIMVELTVEDAKRIVRSELLEHTNLVIAVRAALAKEGVK